MMSRQSLTALVLFLTLLAPIAAQGQLTPSADAFVNSGSPGTNYGDKSTLDIQSARTSLISFDLTPLPSGAGVARATLRLYVTSVNAAGSFNVFPLTSAWTENGITFSNQPTPGALAA